MDKKLKMKWVKALESGRYKQGQEDLKRNGRFCCLGVLRHIVDPRDSRAAKNGSILTRAQTREYGLPPNTMTPLWQMNDGNGRKQHSFREIAQWIRKHL